VPNRRCSGRAAWFECAMCEANASSTPASRTRLTGAGNRLTGAVLWEFRAGSRQGAIPGAPTDPYVPD
jgi:hypothetical protein